MLELDLTTALPEIFIACWAMALLMVGVFRGNQSTRLVLLLSVLTLLVALILVWLGPFVEGAAFSGLFVADGQRRQPTVSPLL